MDAMRYQTFGGTSVATIHMCGDPLGLLAIAPLLKLARFTDNPQWRERAMAIWPNAIRLEVLADTDAQALIATISVEPHYGSPTSSAADNASSIRAQQLPARTDTRDPQ
jgi:hypothetical protein